jgi:hypothetical protein
VSARDGSVDVAALLVEIREELRALRREVAELRGRPQGRCSREDLELLGRLLPAIAGSRGSREFSSAELHAGNDRAIRNMVAHLEPEALGRLLLRADVPVAGLLVERVGHDRKRVLWRVVRATNAGLNPQSAQATRPRLLECRLTPRGAPR